MGNIFGSVFSGLQGTGEVKIEFRDEREGLMGDGFTFDIAAMRHAVSDLQPPMVPKVIICATLPTPEQIDNSVPGEVHFTEEGLVLRLPVSDRFEYSDKALSRLNRNLIHLLRIGAVALEFQTIFSGPIALKVVEMSYPVLMAEAYALAKVYCIQHEELPVKA